LVRATVYEWEREESGESALGGIADKVKTETPLIGLLTKLLSPQGVKGQLTYQECQCISPLFAAALLFPHLNARTHACSH